MDEDIELLRRCQTGDRAARSAFYQKWYWFVFGCARRALARSQIRGRDPEDVVQDAFLMAFSSGSTPHTTLPGWLAKVTRSAVRSRGIWRRLVPLLGGGGDERQPSEGPVSGNPGGPPEEIWRAQVKRALEEASSQLPEELFILWFRYDCEDIPGPRVAEEFGIPEGTLRSKIRKARAQLKAKLERRGINIKDFEDDHG